MGKAFDLSLQHCKRAPGRTPSNGVPRKELTDGTAKPNQCTISGPGRIINQRPLKVGHFVLPGNRYFAGIGSNSGISSRKTGSPNGVARHSMLSIEMFLSPRSTLPT